MVRHDAGMQNSLYNVLLVFASTHPAIGYCQGMNFITGILLLVLHDEAAAYAALAGLFEKFDLAGLFSPGVPDLHRRQYEFAYFTKTCLPDLSAHFKRIGVMTGVFVDKWCMGLFSSYLPVQTLLRVWDAFLWDGWKALVKVGIAALTELRPLFLSMDLEQLSTFLRDNTRTQHNDALSLLRIATTVKVTRAALKRLYSDFGIEQAEHKVEHTERYPDLTVDERAAIDKAKAEIEKFDPLLKQGVQMYQVGVEQLEKEVEVRKAEMQAKEKLVEEAQSDIEKLIDEKKRKVDALRECEELMVKNRGTYVSVDSPFLLTFECRSIQPNSPGTSAEDYDEVELRAAVTSLEQQLHRLQQIHRDKVKDTQFEEFSAAQKQWKEMDNRRESKAKQLEGFVQMWEMKRRDVFLRLSRKLRPSLLVK